MIPVTVVIPTRDEEANLPACLNAVKDFAYVLVVDSGSTDATVEIAKHAGAEVLEFHWDGRFPKKRNWTLRHSKFHTDWVLFLDADEVVTEPFKSEIAAAIRAADCNGYWLTYHDYFQGRLLRHGIPFRKLAFFRVDAGEYERIEEERWSALDMEVHEHPIISGGIGRIESPILHRDYKGLHHYLVRHNEYSSWEARRYIALRQGGTVGGQGLTARQQRKYRWLGSWWFAPAYFIASYFLRGGFLDGRAGFIFSMLKASYFFQIRCKIHELQTGAAGNGAILNTQRPDSR